jgi:hypothetical protein
MNGGANLGGGEQAANPSPRMAAMSLISGRARAVYVAPAKEGTAPAPLHATFSRKCDAIE